MWNFFKFEQYESICFLYYREQFLLELFALIFSNQILSMAVAIPLHRCYLLPGWV